MKRETISIATEQKTMWNLFFLDFLSYILLYLSPPPPPPRSELKAQESLVRQGFKFPGSFTFPLDLFT